MVRRQFNDAQIVNDYFHIRNGLMGFFKLFCFVHSKYDSAGGEDLSSFLLFPSLNLSHVT